MLRPALPKAVVPGAVLLAGSPPPNFLVDADGVIVANNLRGEKLDDKLAELIDDIAPTAEDAKEPLEQPAES